MTKSGSATAPTAARRSSAETRTRLLLAAQSLFAAHGYAGVGIRGIAAQAGVNPALINRYFGSKRLLFEEVANMLGKDGETLAEGDTPVARATRALDEIIDNGEKSPRVIGLRFTLLSALDPDVADVTARAYDKIRRQLMETLPGKDQATRAELVLSLFLGASMVTTLLRSEGSPAIDADYMKKAYACLLAKLFAESTGCGKPSESAPNPERDASQAACPKAEGRTAAAPDAEAASMDGQDTPGRNATGQAAAPRQHRKG